MYRHPRIAPAVYQISIAGPFEATGPGDTPSRRRIFVCRPAGPEDEEELRKADPFDGAAASLPAARRRRGPENAAGLLPEAAGQRGLTRGSRWRSVRCSVNPQFLFRIERDPPGTAPGTAYRISDTELASRLSFFLWSSIPDDELLDLAERDVLSSPACWNSRPDACWQTSDRGHSVTNFAAVAAPAQPGLDDAGRATVSRLRRQPAAGVPPGNGAVLRERPARGPQRARSAQGGLHVSERTARQALRHSARVRQPVPPRVGGRNSQRGGLLRHGSILTVTSYATRTSPVIRGKWVLENILARRRRRHRPMCRR